jgi:nuclear GTP-binding protein
MGTQKKEKNRKERQGKTGDGMGNVKVKGENFYRYEPAQKWWLQRN